MTENNIEERLNDEGFSMNRNYDSEEGYNILHRLGVPPTMEANGMGVGEYDDTFYSKMMKNAKVMDMDMDMEKVSQDEKEDEKDSTKYDLNNGDENMIGFISNEVYYPIKKDVKTFDKDNVSNNAKNGMMELRIGELFENTSMVLNNFDDEFTRALHKVDIEFGYSALGSDGFIKNIKRYLLAFMIYLQEGNNIFYIGITLFIISIILYFINIIRKND